MKYVKGYLKAFWEFLYLMSVGYVLGDLTAANPKAIFIFGMAAIMAISGVVKVSIREYERKNP